MRDEYKKLEKIMIEIDILQLKKQIAELENIDCENIKIDLKNKKKEKQQIHNNIIKNKKNINYKASIINKDCFDVLPDISSNSIDLFLSDIPYGINLDEWDVLHNNTNSALLGSSPAQKGKSGFKKRGKPINGWNSDDRNINKEYEEWCFSWGLMLYDVMKEGAPVLIFGGRRTIHGALKGLERAGFLVKDILAWEKENAHHRSQDIFKVLVKRGTYKLDIEKINLLQNIIGIDLAIKLKCIENIKYKNYKDFIGALNEIDENLKKKYEYEILDIALYDKNIREQVDKWRGWRLGNLAPIYEPIAWLFKPYSSTTLTDNLLKNNVGAMNINECKINGKSPTNLLKFGFRKGEQTGLHEAQKPLELIEYLIKLTTLEEQNVLDCFVGSGTTAVGAKKLNRNYIAIERNKEIYNIAKERVENIN